MMKRSLIFLIVALLASSCKKSEIPTEPITTPQPGAVKLSFAGTPSQIAANAVFTLSVRALRTDNTVDQSFSGAIIVSRASGPGMLKGTLSRSSVAGVATFNDLSVDTAGAYTFAVAAGTLTPAVTAVITATPAQAGPATKLGFVGVPQSATAGSPFSLTVQAQRADNSVDSSYTGTIMLLASGSGTLGGTINKQATAGSATFADLTLSTWGFFTINASSGTLTAGATNTIAVSTILKVGTFTGQNGYVTSGSVQIIRDPGGTDIVKTGSDFRVSGGAGSIGVWASDAGGATNLNGTNGKIRVGLIGSVFSGEYAFVIPGGLASYTHIVTFCEAAKINFGNSQLRNP